MPDAPKADEISILAAEKLLKDCRENNNWDIALEILKKFDKVRSEKIEKNDWYRMTRYLEVAIAKTKNNNNNNNNNDNSNDDKNNTSEENETEGEVVVVTGERTPVLPGI